MTSSSLTIVGAGIVGISCALELQQRGFNVRLIDRQGPAAETSSGNAGIFSSSNITPIASPALIPRLLRLVANLEADFQLNYSQILPMLPWLFRFLSRCNHSTFLSDGLHMHAITHTSIGKHLEWMEQFGIKHLLRKKSAIKLYRNLKSFEHEQFERDLLDRCNVNYTILDNREWLDIEPHLRDIFSRAVVFDDTESVVNPHSLCKAYFDHFVEIGGDFFQAEVKSIEVIGNQWKLIHEGGMEKTDNLVLALGSWTPGLLEKVGYRNPIAIERGYHVIAEPEDGAVLNQPIFDVDASYVISQMDMGLRISTGTNLVYRETKPNPVQVSKVLPRVREAFPLGKIISDEPWMGHRPTAPDSLPLIGAAPRHENLWMAFGHSHMGLTMGPMTGELLADDFQNRPSRIDRKPYSPARFL